MNNNTENKSKRLVVIGAVAAGTSAAAKARRNDESLEITVYERDSHISYSGCGLPYYIGGIVEDIATLTPRDPAFFASRSAIDIRIKHEVLSIDAEQKTVRVRNLTDNSEFTDHYDTLVLATGATAVRPPIPGIDLPHVFTLRTPNDALAIRKLIEERRPQNAVIIGSGFIGLEMVENLAHLGIDVTLVELLPQICPVLDPDMAPRLESYLVEQGIRVLPGHKTVEITAKAVKFENGASAAADLVIVATGIRPNTELARSIGVALGPTGAIAVNDRMQTNLPDIYACGDCAESFSIIDGEPIYRPLGSTANKQGRIVGDVITGGDLTHHGIAGTGIFRVFELNIGTTGLKLHEAEAKGYDVAFAHITKPAIPEYLNGREMVIKAITDRKTRKLLGVQIIGYEGVDKRLDVFVTAMTAGLTVPELAHIDLAYAPPFATTKDPVIYTGMVMSNVLERHHGLMPAEKLIQLLDTNPESVTVIDTRSAEQYEKGHVEGAINISQAVIRAQISQLDPAKTYVTYCNRGVTGNAVQNILLNSGFSKVYNLSGGYFQYLVTRKMIK